MEQKQQHNEKGEYRCQSCNQHFKTQNELRQHESEQHKSQGSHSGQTRGAGGQSSNR